ncbi:transcriptional regulator, TetR family [Amycolatopsis marina]|uniref:Transcriptional regulator, TetR family n=1 Tax=Amycolatopsis marina TaxID=490629 RepID=A0A1I0WXK7_9PSEU|nr:TetR/AcrR family transcriptional regulator [Amycolatopsis marina]SFA93469.1 transcriptional regulator, TetR family [Amycolatopsis marina]
MTENRDVAERRAQILDAAAAVFGRKGLHTAVMADIVAESGLSKGGLYWHFSSKDDIVAGLLQRFFEEHVGAVESIVRAPGPAAPRLRELGSRAVTDLTEFDGSRDLALEFYGLAARRTDVRELLRTYYHRYRELIAALLDQGNEAGEFRVADSADTAMTVIAQFEGLALVRSIAPDSVDLAAQVEHFLTTVIAAADTSPSGDD